MSKGIFSAKLAASTRKAKRIIPEVKPKSASLLVTNVTNKNKAKKIIPKVKSKSTSSVINKNKANKIIPKVKPKSAPSTELESPNDLLNPTDSELPLKQQYAARIWPD